MEFKEATQRVKESWEQLLPMITAGRAKKNMNGKPSYICPIPTCKHGENGDGITFDPKGKPNMLHCFSCHFYGSIIDLYMQTENVQFPEAVYSLSEMLNIQVDQPEKVWDSKKYAEMKARARERAAAGDSEAEKEAGKENTSDSTNTEKQTNTAPQRDYSEYYKKCAAALPEAPEAISYLQGRGISLENALQHGFGYDPVADPAGGGHPTKRIIMPTSSSHYVARAIDNSIDKQYAKLNPKGGKPGLFNADALYSDQEAVFVLEGIIDAVSVMECPEATAIALSSTSNTKLLVDQLKKKPTAATLILSLDNDQAGEKATDQLRSELQNLNIRYVAANICGKQKDANAALQKSRAKFFEQIRRAKQQAAIRPDNVADYISLFMGYDINKCKKQISTGYMCLDKKTGGLYAGLYVVAAISSLGKTTYVHQMADQIAASGQDVLFFSLEQSRLELVSKSIARQIAQDNYADIKKDILPTSLSIRKGNLSPQVQEAAGKYIELVKDKLSIIEGNFNCDISFIGEYIRRYIKDTNTRPVVIIDYLQILQPMQINNRTQTTKESVDYTVTELKRISRELSIPVIAISSVNRANYLAPIDFESLKESGSIEYSADVIYGLQLQCLNNSLFEKEKKIKEKREIVAEAKAATPRKIELVCLKNRYGISRFTQNYEYYPANDLFIECEAPAVEPVAAEQAKPTINRKRR